MPAPSNPTDSATLPTTRTPALRDSPDRYGRISRCNHWLGAALVLALLGIGLYFEDMPRGADKLYWMKLHISLGATAFLFLAFRVYWRVSNRVVREFAQPAALQWLTRLVHLALLLGITVLILTGPLAVWSGGRAIEVFGWFTIPGPIGKLPTLHENLEVAHAVAAKVVLFAVIAHVLGAAKHLLFERERLVGRMIGRGA